MSLKSTGGTDDVRGPRLLRAHDYLAPEGPIAVDLAQREPKPSQILKGSLDRIDEALSTLPA